MAATTSTSTGASARAAAARAPDCRSGCRLGSGRGSFRSLRTAPAEFSSRIVGIDMIVALLPAVVATSAALAAELLSIVCFRCDCCATAEGTAGLHFVVNFVVAVTGVVVVQSSLTLLLLLLLLLRTALLLFCPRCCSSWSLLSWR